jgi:hypothetical protein
MEAVLVKSNRFTVFAIIAIPLNGRMNSAGLMADSCRPEPVLIRRPPMQSPGALSWRSGMASNTRAAAP